MVGEDGCKRDFVAEPAQDPGGVGGVAAGRDAQRGGAQLLVLGGVVRHAEDKVEDGGAGAENAGHQRIFTGKTVLDDAVGKPVTLLMISGVEVTGTVAKVGDSAVQLTRLSGRDFFDGVILLERVDGVILKVRGK